MDIVSIKSRSHQADPDGFCRFYRYGTGIVYVVEIKAEDTAAAEELIRLIYDYGLEDIVIIQSFFPNILKRVKSEFPDMTEDNCTAAQNAGKKFVAWNLDTESQIREAIEIGVDAYFTREPGLALKLENKYIY